MLGGYDRHYRILLDLSLVLYSIKQGSTLFGRLTQKNWLSVFAEWCNRLLFNYVLNICLIQYIYLKSSLIYGSFWHRGRFMKTFRFDTICNITQEPQALLILNCACGFIGKSALIKYQQLLSKVIGINGKSRFDQLATVSSSIPPYAIWTFYCNNFSRASLDVIRPVYTNLIVA